MTGELSVGGLLQVVHIYSYVQTQSWFKVYHVQHVYAHSFIMDIHE